MNDEITALIATLNEQPDSLHADLTPAVHALVRHGITALPQVLPLLEVNDAFTRLRAQRVLEGVTRAWVKAKTPSLPLTRSADEAWQLLWQQQGNYDWQADPELRATAIHLWQQWVAANG